MKPWAVVGIIVACGVVGFGVYAGLIKREDRTARVVSVSWQRFINVEELQPVRDGGFELPAGARVVTSEQRHHHYEEVPFEKKTVTVIPPANYDPAIHGEIDVASVLPKDYFDNIDDVPQSLLGSGVFKTYTVLDKKTNESGGVDFNVQVYEPKEVLRTWYTYDIDKWTVVNTAEASGADKNPRWPSIETVSGKVREGLRREVYFVEFETADTKRHRKEYADSSIWNGFDIGQERVLGFNAVGHFVVN